MAPRALGTLVKVREGERLTRRHYYVQLPDLLMDMVERDPAASQAEGLAALAHSFAHDVLNLAVLAGRLLWYEALTPDMGRSSDLVAAGTDVESYFLFLKAACDLLADVAVALALDEARRGQAPSGSFNDLSRWIRDNPGRIDAAFHFLGQQQWFNELHDIRTNLAHRGYDTLIFTDRVRFSFFTAPFGRTALRILREDAGKRAEAPRHTLSPLLPFIRRLTQSTLTLSDQLAAAISQHRGLGGPSRTHALCGVYVPALHHLDLYHPPDKSPRLGIIAGCLQKCKDYLAATKLGYPDGYWWRFLVALSEQLDNPPAYIGRFAEGPPGVLVDWKTIFAVEDRRLGITARDKVQMDESWLTGAQKDLEEFVAGWRLARAVLVAREGIPPAGEERRDHAPFPLLILNEPDAAAQASFELLTK